MPRYLRLLNELTPASLFDQDFGLGLFEDDLANPRLRSMFLYPSRLGYLRPWAISPSGVSNIVSTKDEFKVNLDVQQFKPEEISVKVSLQNLLFLFLRMVGFTTGVPCRNTCLSDKLERVID